MGFWDFSKPVDINSKLAQARSTENALILDVREPREYEYGHIPGALNLPVNSVGTIRTALKGWLVEEHASQTPLFVYCASGVRSRKAQGILKAMGFAVVENMGGTNRYTGQFEKGPMPAPPEVAPAPESAPGPAPAAEAASTSEVAPASEPAPAAAPAQEDAPSSDSAFEAAPTSKAAPASEPAPKTASAPGLDDLGGPAADPRVDALTAEAVAELEGGNVAVKRFQNEDAAKVYLMSKITGGKTDLSRGILLFAPAAATNDIESGKDIAASKDTKAGQEAVGAEIILIEQ